MKACNHKPLEHNQYHKTLIMQPIQVMLFNDAWDVKTQQLNMENINTQYPKIITKQ